MIMYLFRCLLVLIFIFSLSFSVAFFPLAGFADEGNGGDKEQEEQEEGEDEDEENNDDTITIGDNNTDDINSGNGIDTITVGDNNIGNIDGGNGDDSITVGDNNSGQIDGGGGTDFIRVGENNSGDIFGGNGDDTIVVGYGNTGTIDGGKGNNSIVYVPPAPSASPSSGTYTSLQKITLSSDDSGSIRYTVDGSVLDCLTGALYESPISVFSTKTITAVGCEQGYASPVASFLYTIEKIEAVPLDLHTLLTENVFVPQTGSASATTKLTVEQNIEIKVASNSESKVVLEKDLEISRVDDEVFDANLLTSSETEIGSLVGLAEGSVVKGALRWGIANIGLKFSEPITVSIFVGSDLNGETLNVVRSVDGAGGWTDDGIVAPATCVVADGLCEFQATKASYYAVYSEEEEALPQTNNSGGGGGSGGGAPCYCIPEINYENDDEAKVDTQEEIIEEEIASKSAENVFQEEKTDEERAVEEEIVEEAESKSEFPPISVLSGALLVSDNLDKGNLMLLFGNSIVYIKTSRDFSDLVDKNVVVSVEGTLDKFVLLEIKEDQTKTDLRKTEKSEHDIPELVVKTNQNKKNSFIRSLLSFIGRLFSH